MIVRANLKSFIPLGNPHNSAGRGPRSAGAFAIAVLTTAFISACSPAASNGEDGTASASASDSVASSSTEQQDAPQVHAETVDLGISPAAVPGFGGLSGLEQLAPGKFVAISDDKGDHGPARAYVLDTTDEAGPRVEETIEFTGPAGNLIDPHHVDAEEIRVLTQPNDATPHLLYTSEGDPEASNYGSPVIVETDRQGKELRRIEPPQHHIPDEAGTRGVRPNKGPEAMAVAPDGSYFVTINENALIQDGPENSLEHGSRTRMTFYDIASGNVLHEYALDIDPLYPGAIDRGVASLDFDDDGNLYMLERGFLPVSGNRAEIYRLDVSGATDVKDTPALDGTETPVSKTQVIDLSEVFEDIRDIDNVEGLDAAVPQGRTAQEENPARGTTFTLVTDDNFSDKQRSLLHTIEIL